MIHKIEIDFALPVELTGAQYELLHRFVGQVCDANCPDGWCFWPAGQGSKPNFSQADAMFLGKEPDPNAPPSGEPTWDDSIFHIDCAAREAYPEEITRKKERAERKAQRVAETKSKWHARLAGWLFEHGWKRASWLVADVYFFCHRNFGSGRHA